MRVLLPTLCLLVAACGDAPADPSNAVAPEEAPAPATPVTSSGSSPETSLAPGEVGGLPDDRAPLEEGPIDERSGQGAAQVVQLYFGLIEDGRYGDAWRLWSDGGRASGMSESTFAAGFSRYDEYHAEVGAPGRVEGAAGSLYVNVPVRTYGRLAGGQSFNETGSVTMRRSNDVPGSTDEQRRWRIVDVEVGA